MDVEECGRCGGSGEIAISARTGRFVAAGPVPEDARGVARATCPCCGGTGYVETNEVPEE